MEVPPHSSTGLTRRDRRVTCILADRQAPILRGARDFLESRGLDVLGVAQDGQEALALIEQHRPNVAVLDPNLPTLDGIEVTARTRASSAGTHVIIYSDVRYRELLVDALQAGARGFIVKDAPLRDLVRAVQMVCDGRYSVNVRLLGLLEEGTRLRRAAGLTTREREVLRLVVNGLRGTDMRRGATGPAADVGGELTRAVSKLEIQRVRLGPSVV